MNNPIGILDSGLGGLTVWKEIATLLPHESTVYIADSKNCPYGNRSKEEIYPLAKRLVQFLVEKKCKVVVVACNTITVTCIDELRRDFPGVPIVGIVPVVKTAAERSSTGRIGVLSTVRTAESAYQKKMIATFAGDCTVINIGTDKIVPLVEVGNVDKVKDVEEVLREVLQPFVEAQVDTLALGCSHFPFFKDSMQKIMGENVQILDSSGAIARQVERILEKESLQSMSKSQEYSFYTTGDIMVFSEVLKSIGYNSTVEHIEL